MMMYAVVAVFIALNLFHAEGLYVDGGSNELDEGTEVCLKYGVVCPKYDGEFPAYAPLSNYSQYCECSNGRPYLFSCPDGLIFNKALNVCDWPEPSEYNLILGDKYISKESSELDEGTEVCKKAYVVCPEYDGEFPVYASINYGSQYCECSNGRPYLFSCPDGLKFNSTLNVCDWPEPSEYNLILGDKYISKESSELDEGTEVCKKAYVVCPEYDGEFPVYASINYGSQYCECSNGRPYLFSCPDGLKFNTTLNVCDWPEPSEYNLILGDKYISKESSELDEGTEVCKKAYVVCPEYDGEFPVYASINYGSQYCECSNGRPYLFSCPDGLKFNTTLNVCDWPEPSEYNLILGDKYISKESSELDEGTEVCKKAYVVCPEYDGEFPVYASINYGSQYCECSNGRPYLFSCPDGLKFNTTLNVCDWPEPSEYNLILGDKYISKESSELDEGTEVCKKAYVVCPEYDGEFPVYASINYGSQYCECSNGRPYLFSCPDGLKFNTTLNVCDWPEPSEYNLILGDKYISKESSELDEGTEVCKKAYVVCPEYDGEFPVYASINYGSQYCECSNGRPYLFSCPDGLKFNTTLNVCDWPEPSEYNLILGDKYISKESSEIDEGTEVCKKAYVVCPEYDGEFPVYASINYGSQYCECSNGRPYLFSCPDGLKFNTTLNVCDWPEPSEYNLILGDKYISKESSELDEGTEVCKKAYVVCPEYDGEFPVYASINYGSQYCECSNGRPYLFSCPDGLKFNTTLNVCDWPEPSEYNLILGDKYISKESSELDEGTEVCKKNYVVCPEYDGEFPVYASIDNGSQYCECSNGRPYLFSCPGGLLFNKTLNVCDWPESKEY